MKIENLSTLKIHKLTQLQYDREKEAGRLDENAFYLTPDEEIDLSGYATTDEVSEALTSSKTYTDGQIAAIPTPDVSGQIATHNEAEDAHNDIREAIANENTRATETETNLETKITEEAFKIATLIGNDEEGNIKDAGKSVRTIANEELAASLIPENANEGYRTLQEIAAWIQQHPEDAAAMNANIEELKASKMDKENPTGTGSFSLNREAETTIGDYSFASGNNVEASGESSHAEGECTQATALGAHAEGGFTEANGIYSHAEGYRNLADGNYQHVQGVYNISDTTSAHIVGNGSSNAGFSNAHTLDWDGNAWFAGDVYVGSTSGTNKDEGSKKLLTMDSFPVVGFIIESETNTVQLKSQSDWNTFQEQFTDTPEHIILQDSDNNIYTYDGKENNYHNWVRYENYKKIIIKAIIRVDNITLTKEEEIIGSISVSATLKAADWASNTQEIEVTNTNVLGQSNEFLVIPIPSNDYKEAYTEAGIEATEENWSGDIFSLKFTCETIPTSDITLSIVLSPMHSI